MNINNNDDHGMGKGEATHLLLSDDLVKPVRNDYNEATTHTKQRSFSWTRCLCRTLLVVVIVLFVLFTVAAAGMYMWMRHQVHRFTIDGNPEPLPITPMPATELNIIVDKAKLFWDELRAGQVPEEDLMITADHFNGFIATSDFLRGNAFVTLQENKALAQLRLPAKGLPGGKGRYFVGQGRVNIFNEEEDAVVVSNHDEKAHVVMQLTADYKIPGLDFADILLGKFSVYKMDGYVSNEDEIAVELDFGQFLNWVAPDDWIARRENLLNCDNMKEHCHHGSSSSSSDSSSSDSGDSSDDDDEDCQEVVDTLTRLESIKIQDGQLVFTPIRDNSISTTTTGINVASTINEEDKEEEETKDGNLRRRLTENSGITVNLVSSWKRNMLRRALRAAF